MHRDFKLANIFVNNDTLVIGDFGFAKMGADVAQTILGTPITMAPELQDPNSASGYTNKADIWSIGVVFFQMLFGKAPFVGFSIKEIYQNIKKNSGANLRFPKPVSQNCQDLLRSLLTMDPEKRISWHGFFNHPLFLNYNKKSRFNDEFNSHKKSNFQSKYLTNDELANLNYHVNTKKININDRVSPNNEEIEFRYYHELNKISFIIYLIKMVDKYLRLQQSRIGLGPQRDSLSLSFKTIQFLLAKKGLAMAYINTNTLKSKTNLFRIKR